MAETRIGRFWRWMAPNAVWDGVKYLGGTTMLSGVGHFFWLEFHRSPVDWWWLFALMAGGGAMIFVAKKNDHSDAISDPAKAMLQFSVTAILPVITDTRWNGFASEAELREAEHHARIMSIGERLEGVLEPLQIEAIRLAYDLGVFAKSVEPMPQPEQPHTFDGIFSNAVGPRWAWICKVQAEYEDKYAPRVLAFTRTLGYAGRHNSRLQHFVEHIADLDSLNTLRAQLWKEALYPLDIDFQGE